MFETYDIAQAYECVLKKLLVKDLEFPLAIATRAQYGIQQVCHSAAAIAARIHSLQRERSDRTVIVSKTILKVVLSYLAFRYYRIAGLVVEQRCGIPIGGFMSSA